MPNFHHPHSVKLPSVGRSYSCLQTGFAMPPTERDFTQMVLSADHRILRIAALTAYHGHEEPTRKQLRQCGICPVLPSPIVQLLSSGAQPDALGSTEDQATKRVFALSVAIAASKVATTS